MISGDTLDILSDMEPTFSKKPRPVTKHPVGLKLSFLGVRLLSCMVSRHKGTPLAEKKGPLVDRLILQEARAIRGQDPKIEALLSEAGL